MVAMAAFPRRPAASRRSPGRRRGYAPKIPDSIFGSYIDEVLMVYRPNEVEERLKRLYYHTNDLYSVYALTDGAGTVVERYIYDPYGKVTVFAPDGTTVRTASLYDNPWTFTGRRLDGETGLMYYRNRMYSVDLGRFIRRDPKGYVDGFLLYESPASRMKLDPSGGQQEWVRAEGLIGDWWGTAHFIGQVVLGYQKIEHQGQEWVSWGIHASNQVIAILGGGTPYSFECFVWQQRIMIAGVGSRLPAGGLPWHIDSTFENMAESNFPAGRAGRFFGGSAHRRADYEPTGRETWDHPRVAEALRGGVERYGEETGVVYGQTTLYLHTEDVHPLGTFVWEYSVLTGHELERESGYIGLPVWHKDKDFDPSVSRQPRPPIPPQPSGPVEVDNGLWQV